MVLVTTLGLAGAAIYWAFGSFLETRLDGALRDNPFVFGTPTAETSDHGIAVQDAPGPRATPYVRLIRTDGVVVTMAGRDADGRSFTAELPSRLPAVAPSDSAGGPAVFFDTASHEPGGPRLRVKVAKDAHGNVLVLALSRSEDEALLRRLALVERYVAAAALATASAAVWWMVRKGLGPLRGLAEAVGSLDLSNPVARVHIDATSSEVHDLATATNLLIRRMDEALAREQATQDSLRRFVADASHELRTPTAAISAYAQLFELGARDRPDDLARSMSGIQRETSRMRDLVEELLTLTAADGPIAHETQPVDVRAVVEQAVDAALTIAPCWTVTVGLDPGLGTVLAEPVHLRRALDNLLNNVRAHTPSGTHARVEACRDGTQIAISVADDGPGLTAGERAQMFDRFWRKDTSRSRQAGGTGLGLSIVACLAHSWNGHVTASQTPGGGLTVCLHLPAGPMTVHGDRGDLASPSTC
jgi:two-component system OmpR family sensor kinase